MSIEGYYNNLHIKKIQLVNDLKYVECLMKLPLILSQFSIDLWWCIFKHLKGDNRSIFDISHVCGKWRRTVIKYKLFVNTKLINDLKISDDLPFYAYILKSKEHLIFKLLIEGILKFNNYEELSEIAETKPHYAKADYLFDFDRKNDFFEHQLNMHHKLNIYGETFFNISIKIKVNSNQFEGIEKFKTRNPSKLKGLIIVFKFKNLEYGVSLEEAKA